ncbi:hypothetical protein CDL12_19123 [Handroanthus impetiginosus]|uniref:BHLH domain-containing protein n=1 Tax=Handroanthus impetiginosus TaxID=429701 RepID=A0A2G9GTG2_9LAMI|nr:hypothetical protein CDL12_19123 [Handroanthus impetiginosus]
MMNEAVAQSSPVQQMVAAAGPKWWCINNIQALSHLQHHSFLAAPPENHFPHHLITAPLVAPAASSIWTDCEELLPESWSQLLSGRLVGEEDNYKGSGTKLDKWGKHHLLNQFSSDTNCAVAHVIKQENSNVEFQAAKSTNCWSPCSCVTTLSSIILYFPHKSSQCNSTAAGGPAKKARIQPSSSAQSAIKVRKEKLGDRITALHQLVSPFGKTDTASVLLEVTGYIRFLQSQIEALSLPYFGSTSSGNISRQQPECDKEPKKDLKSIGLCLVPVSCCTLDVGSHENGADYWAPAAFGPSF